ncbi:hypothetical protein [Jannaschia formosa]|uniref:hypothetical protein n=1 Tax=Jannaschia formosa TaxID=2259592 RepID=UPI000E1B99D6|nr:hypothetical protein [Jannaschia formosa]TFL18109.1 hypothetical protein DR046_11760 [Jannaschia formosa]
MFRLTAAILLSAALALPGAAARAEVAGTGAARILGGSVTILVLPDRVHRREAPRHAWPDGFERHPVHRPDWRPGWQRHPVHPPHGHRDHRAQRDWPHGEARIVPARCESWFHGVRGAGIGYDGRCMRNNVPRPGLLPTACLRQVQTSYGWREVYPRDCLYRAGWQLPPRRH